MRPVDREIRFLDRARIVVGEAVDPDDLVPLGEESLGGGGGLTGIGELARGSHSIGPELESTMREVRGETLTEVIDAVHRAAPFGSVSHLPKPWKFVEVFLFQDDRRFKPRTLDVDIDLGNGRRLTGTVTSIFGNRLVTVTYSRLAAKHRLRSWIDLLALSAGHPDESWTAHALGRGKAGTTRAMAGPLDHRAEVWLRDLVDIWHTPSSHD